MERHAKGLAFWLLDVCGQLGCVCCVPVVCGGGTDPCRRGQGGSGAGGMLSFGLRPASSTHHKSWGMEYYSRKAGTMYLSQEESLRLSGNGLVEGAQPLLAQQACSIFKTEAAFLHPPGAPPCQPASRFTLHIVGPRCPASITGFPDLMGREGVNLLL